MTLGVGTKLGRYEIRSQIGAGGMGEVYLAEDTLLHRKVALKLIPAVLATNRARLARLEQEAFAASALNHPNILTVFELGESNNGRFIATEYVDGETLRQRMRHSRLSVREALEVATQVASALTAAHKAAIVHRDIKPENIMVRHDDAVIKVLDFGLAKLTERQLTTKVDTTLPTKALVHTDSGVVMGTAQYMSPEQARGLEVDPRTDIWSLGVVLYEIVTGRLPFEGQTSSDVISDILRKEPPALTLLSDEADERLDEIVTKTLTKDREERYQSAKDLFIDLKRLKQHLDFEAEIERTVPPELRPTKGGAADSKQEIVTGQTRSAARSATADETRPTSGGGHIVTAIKQNKKRTILLAVLATLAIAVSVRFIFFRAAPALTEADTILLTDFVNTTGDEVFDGTLKQALAVQLGQSPFLNMLSEDRVRETLKFMGRSPDERVTRDVGREICQRQGLKAMLTGSISNLGNHYVITLEAINAETSDAITRGQVEADSKEQVLKVLGEAARKLREQLGESLASIQNFDAPPEQATTSSLDALKAYSLGVEHHLKGKYLEAIPLYKRAMELDGNFALAYARLSAVYFNTRQFGLAAEASQKAYDLKDRVSERERLFIAANYYDDVTRELEKKIETLELWKRTYPRDYVPHNNLALQYNNLGQFEKGIEEAREAIRINPNAGPAHSNLASAFVGLNRFDEAKDVIERALSQKIETTQMHRNLYMMAFFRTDVAAMRQQIEWANGKPDEHVAQVWQAETATFSGQLRKAKEFSNHAVALALRQNLQTVTTEITGIAAFRDALFGNCKQVKAQTGKLLATTQRSARLLAANAMARCGEISQTRAITDELLKQYPKDTLLSKCFLPVIQASDEMYRGNAAQAVQLLENTRPYEGAWFFAIVFLRGEAYLRQQKAVEATAEFQRILDRRGWQLYSTIGNFIYPLSYLGLARAAALSGDTTKARKAYQDLFAVWKDADPDLPMLIEARKEYENLK